VYHIDARWTLFLHQYRSRESEVGDGKYKKDPKEHVVPTHFYSFVGCVTWTGQHDCWLGSAQNKSEERDTHYPVSSNLRKDEQGERRREEKLQAVDMFLYLNVNAVDISG